MTHDFKTFDKVLYRYSPSHVWAAGFYERKFSNNNDRHYIVAKEDPMYCLPYEGNEYLLGTTLTLAPEHKFKWGDKVTAHNKISGEELYCIFIEDDPDEPQKYWKLLCFRENSSYSKVDWKLRSGWDEEDEDEE